MPSQLYNSEDIIGKVMYAKTNVPVKRLAYDAGKVFKVIPPGHMIGRVYSFVVAKPNQGRSHMYWMYLDEEDRAYYTPHIKGLYDFGKIRSQGVLTKEEKVVKQTPAWYQYSSKLVTGGLLLYGAIKIGSALLNNKNE